MHRDEIEKEVMNWYGWGSPIGLTVFFVGLAVCAAIIRFVFLGHQ